MRNILGVDQSLDLPQFSYLFLRFILGVPFFPFGDMWRSRQFWADDRDASRYVRIIDYAAAFHAATALAFFQSTAAFEQFMPISSILDLSSSARGSRCSFVSLLPLRGFNKVYGRRIRTVVAVIL